MLNKLRVLKNKYKVYKNSRKVNEIGLHSEVGGAVDKRQSGSIIEIGNDCMINGSLITNTEESYIKIKDNVFVGGGTIIESACGITIMQDVLISYDCIIADSNNHSISYSIRKNDLLDWKQGFHDWNTTNSKEVYINRGAWVGARCIILKGVSIGEGSVVAAGSVVVKDVEPWTIVGGNPAKLIRRITENER